MDIQGDRKNDRYCIYKVASVETNDIAVVDVKMKDVVKWKEFDEN